MSKPLKVAQWMPAYNEQVSSHICAQLLRDQASMLRAGHTHGYWSNHSCDLVLLRNQALHKAITNGWDFLMMQDADVFSECDGGPLIRLLGTALETGATVTGACVSMRTRPPKANVLPLGGGLVMPGTVFEAEKIGTGMVLINLNKVREWYGTAKYTGKCFDVVYESYEDETGLRHSPGIAKVIGMDILFTKYLVREQMGQTVWCDARIPTTHVDGVYRHDFDGQTIPDLAGNQGTDLAELGTATAALTGD